MSPPGRRCRVAEVVCLRPELAHLVRNVRRGPRPGVVRGFAGRCRPDRFHLGPGRRFGAPAPRHQREPGSARPRGQGPLPPPGGPVPGPDHSPRNNRGVTGHPLQRPRGPGPVQTEHQRLPPRRGPAVITSHPGIVAQAARACQAPGLPLPRRCRPAGAAAAMLRSGRIRARTPPLICSTGISRQGCGARVTACPRCGSTPRRGLKLEPW